MSREEQIIQQACVRWFRYAHPSKILFAVNNNTDARNVRKGAINKSMGVMAGVSDLVLCHEGVTTFIELKTAKGRQNDNQKRFEKLCSWAKFDYHLIRSFDEFEALINNLIK